MNKKIGIIASDKELKNKIIQLFKDDIDNGKIIIDILNSDIIDKQGRLLESKGVKAIIARSGSYRHTIGTVNIPVIHLNVTTPDILQALSIAKKYNKDIVLVISDLDYFDYKSWKDLINANIILERFHSKDEIYDRVYKYIDRKDDVIIVGGGIPCSHARNWGMDNVFINASTESIYESINYAKETIDNLYEQKYNNEVLKTVLDEVHDAVVAVNHEGKIKIYNEKAKELLKKDKEEVINEKLTNVFPQLNFIIDVLESKKDKNNEIKYLGNITITANTSIFKVDGNVEGALCSFQDISKLQSLEKKIRYKLNKKGHIAKYTFDNIVAVSPIMKNIITKAKKIGQNDNTVIIYGESGTGKEIVAQGIHNISKRKQESFVAINCAAISENLLESELFGYEEGAFTGARKDGKPGLFEIAHGGTIFLDEINSMSLNLQSKLLRVLEERETMRIGSDYVIPLDIRIIAATNENLKTMVDEGRFRRDLFYRLNVLELHIPPLNERKEDIIPLFNYYLNDLSDRNYFYEINSDIKEKLLNYKWPGNARELRNIVQRYIIFKEIDLKEINKVEDKSIDDNIDLQNPNKIIDLKEINKFVEQKVIDMLSNKGMTKTEIAKILGISRTALWKKMKNKE